MALASAGLATAPKAVVILLALLSGPVQLRAGALSAIPWASSPFASDATALGTINMLGTPARASLSRAQTRDSFNVAAIVASAALTVSNVFEACMNNVYPPAITTVRLITAIASEMMLHFV